MKTLLKKQNYNLKRILCLKITIATKQMIYMSWEMMLQQLNWLMKFSSLKLKNKKLSLHSISVHLLKMSYKKLFSVKLKEKINNLSKLLMNPSKNLKTTKLKLKNLIRLINSWNSSKRRKFNCKRRWSENVFARLKILWKIHNNLKKLFKIKLPTN